MLLSLTPPDVSVPSLQSYIDVLDFDTPAELAVFLLDLAGNEEEYLSYFWWKVSRAQHVQC